MGTVVSDEAGEKYGTSSHHHAQTYWVIEVVFPHEYILLLCLKDFVVIIIVVVVVVVVGVWHQDILWPELETPIVLVLFGTVSGHGQSINQSSNKMYSSRITTRRKF